MFSYWRIATERFRNCLSVDHSVGLPCTEIIVDPVCVGIRGV